MLRGVVLPDAAPILAATGMVLFVLDWNQLLIPLVLTGIDVRTLPVILTDFFTLEWEVDWPTAAAAITISLVPLLVLVGLPPVPGPLQPRAGDRGRSLMPARRRWLRATNPHLVRTDPESFVSSG